VALGYEKEFRTTQGLVAVTLHDESKIFGLGAIVRLGAARLVRFGLIVLSAMLAGCLVGSGGDSSDPVVVENPVVFVKRPLLFDEDNGMLIGDNLAEPAAFRPGARLFLKDRASPNALVTDISSGAFPGGGPYDVKDLSVSFDGTRVVFAMRAPEIEGADEEDQPTWNIWEYDVTDRSLRRIIASDFSAEEGQDISPAYLPDGRIVFASTRQKTSRAVLSNEGKAQYAALEEERDVHAFVLHVMDANGDRDTIEQITFNQSHDLDPLVQDDGTILFSRWDNAGQTRDNGFNFYRVNPDGTGLTYVYGRHSHDSVGGDTAIQYLSPRLTDTGRILTALRPFETDNFGAIPTTVDTAGFVEANLAVDGSTGSGQSPLVSDLSIGDGISLNGNYGSVSPLLDGSNRYLVSWSPCRLRLIDGGGTIVNCTSERVASGNYQAAPPIYGLWLLDASDQTQRPIERADEGQQFEEAVLLRQRSLPTFISDSQYYENEESTLADEGFGILDITSVYDIDGVDMSPEGSMAKTANPSFVPPDELPKRFVRVEKPVSIPGEEVLDFDNNLFGRSNAQGMREILGYAPIEPDGSVRVAVPADVAFAISVLDDKGQRIGPRHQNWLSLRPGETLECSGCHNPNSKVPHGRKGAEPASVYGGSPTNQAFDNTDSTLLAQMYETMAQTWARLVSVDNSETAEAIANRKSLRLSPDVVYEDKWTDLTNPDLTAGTEIYLRCADLETPAPIQPFCLEDWKSTCRVVINYEQHIHSLWVLDRKILEEKENESDPDLVIADYTCTACHSDVYIDMDGVRQPPAAQLDLTDGLSDQEPDHFKSYRELFFGDNKQVINEVGELVDRTEEEFVLDENGELILDPVTEEPIIVNVPVPFPGAPYLSTAGARASSDFFDILRAGGTHENFLSPAELRLISEWLDIGGQYYNNPFDAPAD